MKLKDIWHIKHLLIITTSEKPSSESFRIHITAKKVLYSFLFYSFLIFISGYFILNALSVHQIIGTSDQFLPNENEEKLIELNKRIFFLSEEISKLKITNERLRYAILIADSSVISYPKDSLKIKQSLKKKTEGNILGIIQLLIQNLFSSKTDDGYFTRPVNGFISREFNPEEGHYGVDFVAKTGTPIHASASGYAVFSDYTSDDGYMIIIVHPNDYISIYKHCSSLLKRKRDRVLQGEVIALSGNTGHGSSGAHLHFELWKKSKPLNPLKYFIN